MLIVWVGDGVVDLPIIWLVVLMMGVGLTVIIGFSQAERIEQWSRVYVTKLARDEKQLPQDEP